MRERIHRRVLFFGACFLTHYYTDLREKRDDVQVFVDDVVIVLDRNTAINLQIQANAALVYVQQWGIRNKLKFALQKICAMDTSLLSMGD